MPVSFWGDSDGSKYRSAYFEAFLGEDVWAHGDYVKVMATTTSVVFTRRRFSSTLEAMYPSLERKQ